MNVWDCPNGRDFTGQIRDILGARRSHLILYAPPALKRSVCDGLLYAYDKNGKGDDVVFAETRNPGEALRELAEVDKNATDDELADTVTYWNFAILTPAANPGAADGQNWRRFFSDLAKLSKSKLETGDGLFWVALAVLPFSFPRPTADVCLDIREVYSPFRASDVEYAFERLLRERDSGTPFSLGEKLWLYSLCLGLGANDPDGCELIFKKTPKNEAEAEEFLREHPLCEFCDAKILEAVIRGETKGRLRREDEILLKAAGELIFDDFGGERAHPAALYMANLRKSWRKRLVQGQTRVFLPLTAEVHNILWRELAEVCESGWHKRDEKNFSSIDVEIGPLFKYMKTYLKGRYTSRLYDLAETWKDIRNTLAHGSVLDYETALKGASLLEEFRDR